MRYASHSTSVFENLVLVQLHFYPKLQFMRTKRAVKLSDMDYFDEDISRARERLRIRIEQEFDD